MVVCGRRFGKSILGEDRIVPAAVAGYPCAWFAPDYKSLLEVWRDLCRILGPLIAKKDQQQKRLDLTTGGVIECWSMDRDPEQCRGRKYYRVIIDEAAKARHLEVAWQEAIRPTLLDFKGTAWFLTTPRGRDFVCELFQRGQKGGGDKPDLFPAWASWQMPTSTNPFISPQEIEDLRTELPATIFSQEILAEFLDVGGRFFDEWEETRGRPGSAEERDWHVVTPFSVPRTWRFFGGLDYGTRSPFAFLLGAVDPLGDPWLIDEAYQSGLLPEQQAQEVLAVLERNGVPRDSRGRFLCQIMSDPSMFPPRDPIQRVGAYEIEPFWAAGLSCVRAMNARRATNTRVREWLHSIRVTKLADGTERADPRLRVFRGRCANLIRTVPLMTTLDKDPEDFDTTLEDHIVDGFRYACGSMRLKAAGQQNENIPLGQKALPFELRDNPRAPATWE